MKINNISAQSQLSELNKTKTKNTEGFDDLIKGFIENVNDSQQESKSKTKEFLTGGDVKLHEVMIAGEKAKTNLELLLELRNKTLDMYKEITRMQ